MKKLLALLLLLWAGPAFAQSNPGWTFGFVPTAAQWNAEWSSKVDVNLAGIPVTSGGTGGIIWGAGNPLIGAGSGALTQGTRSGNTTVFGTVNGVLTAGDCVSLDSSFNLVDAGGVCTTGGGGGTVTSALINELAWYNANGTAVVGLATCNSGVIVTSASGVPSCSTVAPLPHFANNTALSAVASTAYATVVRDGFAAVGDSPALTFITSNSACSIASGAGDGGSQVPTSDGKCWLANFPASGAALSDWGADPTDTSDSTVKTQSALNALNGKYIPLLVDGAYKIGTSGTGISVPNGVTLAAVNYQPNNPTIGPRFVCNNQLAYICVLINTGGGLNSTGMQGVSVVGSGTTPVAGAIGLEWNGGYAAWATNVKVSNFDTCVKWLSSSTSGINFTGFHLNAALCKTHYLVFDGWAEAHMYATRLGDDGTGDFDATDAIRFQDTSGSGSGSGPNTIDFDQLQFNAGNGDYAGCILSFGGYSAGGGFQGEFKFTNSHLEEHNSGGTAVICTDSTVPALTLFHMSNTDMSLGGANVPLFALNSNTALIQDFFSDNQFGGCTGATLAPSPVSGPAFGSVNFTNNFGCGMFSVTSNGTGANILNTTGNSWNTEAIAGNWDGDLVLGDTPVAGLTNTATGNIVVVSQGAITVSNQNAGGALVSLLGNGGSTPNKYIRAYTGYLQTLNSNFSVTSQLTDAGSYSVLAQLYPGTGAALQSAGGWLASTGNPSSGVGNNGDFYMRTDCTHGSSDCIWHKESGSWQDLN